VDYPEEYGTGIAEEEAWLGNSAGFGERVIRRQGEGQRENDIGGGAAVTDKEMKLIPGKILNVIKEIDGRWSVFSGFSASIADGVRVISSRGEFNGMVKEYESTVTSEYLRLRGEVMMWCDERGGFDYFRKEINLTVSSAMAKMKYKNVPKKFSADERIGQALRLSEVLLVWNSISSSQSQMAAAIDAIYPHQGIPCGWKPAKGSGRGVVSVYRP
jgi:hypothetical protein